MVLGLVRFGFYPVSDLEFRASSRFLRQQCERAQAGLRGAGAERKDFSECRTA